MRASSIGWGGIQIIVMLMVGARLGAPAGAQTCEGQWLPGGGVPGVVGTSVDAVMAWDPDAAGPEGALLMLGGEFWFAGDAGTSYIAACNLATGRWSALGTGLNGPVYALATALDGDLLVGGRFRSAGGVATNAVARWNGSSWAALGDGLGGAYDGRVEALAVLPNGSVIAGGAFDIGTDRSVALWNGTEWSALGAGVNGTVHALAILPDGDVVAGGAFSRAGGVAVRNIAHWDGYTWSPLGGGVNADVDDLCVMADGRLVAAGRFSEAGGVTIDGLAVWDGVHWDSIGGFHSYVRAVLAQPDGSLIAGGAFEYAGGSERGVEANGIARWDGQAWSELDLGMPWGRVDSLATMPDGTLIAGGYFYEAGRATAYNVARWNGQAWAAVSPGIGYGVSRLAALPSGDVVAVGGTFQLSDGSTERLVARWDGLSWQSMRLNLSARSHVSKLATLPNGELVSKGALQFEGYLGLSAVVAKWSGGDWLPLGGLFDGSVDVLVASPSGDLVVGGSFRSADGVPARNVALWTGVAWTPLGDGLDRPVTALAALPTGEVVAAGSYGVSGSPVNRWDGERWHALGSGFDSHIHALVIMPNGDIIAGGEFQTAGGAPASGIARWDGRSWSPLGLGIEPAGLGAGVFSLLVRPNGNLLASGSFSQAGGSAANNIARWDGTSWYPLGEGTSGQDLLSCPCVMTMGNLPSGELAAGGWFLSAGGHASAFMARWTDTNVPTIARQPQPRRVNTGQTLVLSATPSPGYSNVRVQWWRDGVAVTDGPGGASPGGGDVHGGRHALESPTRGWAAVLTIANVQPGDAGEYRAQFGNDCGTILSEGVVVSVAAAVEPGDLDCDGRVNTFDIDGFVLALTDPAAYRAAYPGCNPQNGDINEDGLVNNFDIDPFVVCITNGGCP